MKLELKHLAPYLPYGLMFMRVEENCDRSTLPVTWLGTYYQQETNLNCNSLRDLLNGNYKEPKLILRPLSDLTKTEFEMDSLHKGAIQFMDETANLPQNSRTSHVGSIMYADMLKLFEWHFDVFGLIPEGLAIDINTLEK